MLIPGATQVMIPYRLQTSYNLSLCGFSSSFCLPGPTDARGMFPVVYNLLGDQINSEQYTI